MCGPLSVEYMTIVSSARPWSSRNASTSPTSSSWSTMVSWYSDCHRPALPRLPSLRCVRKCMWVVLSQTKNGVSPARASVMNLSASGTTSSSIGLHPLLGQRTGVLDALGAVVVRPGMDDAPGTEVLAEVRELLFGRVVVELGLLLGVEVVQVAEELVEAVRGRQELVTVPEVVLAELAGGVPQGLQRGCDGRVLGTQPDVGTGHAHLGEPRSIGVLSGDEGRPARRTALLAVVVGEPGALGGDPVDVRGPVAHQAVAVAAQVADPDVVTPDDQDVGPLGHGYLLSRSRQRSQRGLSAQVTSGHPIAPHP